LVSGANRVGKSVATGMEVVAWAPFSKLIWIMGPSYFHSRKEFEYAAEWMLNAGLTTESDISMPQREHLACTMKTALGCTIQSKTLKDMAKALQSESPDLLCLCEAGLVPEDPLDRMRIRLVSSRGRLWISGTMEEAADWLRQAYDRWEEDWQNEEMAQSFNVPLWYNVHDFPGGEKNPEIAYLSNTLQPNVYTEKIEGRPAPSEYLVFGKYFKRGRFPFFARQACDFQPKTPDGVRWPVEIAIDPGYHPSYYSVTALQRHGQEVWAFDEVVDRGVSHEVIINRCKERQWWPHVIGGTIDAFAARSHGLGYQASPLDIWTRETKLPLRADLRPNPQEVIERFRYYLVHPTTGDCLFYFNAETCPHLLHELRRWRYHKDVAGRPIKTEPQRRNCDSIKAIGYWMVDEFSRTSWELGYSPEQNVSVKPFVMRL
jgi:hypothetical protein